jgi:leader peptidase (prepilin peptidase)/N-methyltransferase
VVVALAVVGIAWGLACDRLAARWPAHEDGSVRGMDWRTAIVPLVAAVALGGLADRAIARGWTDHPPTLLLFGAYFLTLVLLLATDLDQRLLPDVITLPAIPIALLAGLGGLDPLVAGALPAAVAVAVVVPVGLYLLSIPFGAGAIGMGDLKLLVSVGLVSGLARTVIGVVAGALVAGVVVAALLATRRVTLKSYIPFGPFLIIGAMWGILVAT